MANLNKIIYLSEEQKNTLFSSGSVSVGSSTITYNDNDLYLTPAIELNKAFTVSLASSLWTSSAQTVSNSNFLSSGYAYFVAPNNSSIEAYGKANIHGSDVEANNEMTFYCAHEPTTDITVNVVRMMVS